MKYVYQFYEGNGKMKDLLGGKGAGLAEMTVLGMPVPKGFTVTTEACTRYYADGETISGEIQEQIFDALKILEKESGKRFGDAENPLLVSVRSGARVSMPGMMDTILNLGINDTVADALSRLTNNPRFVWDSYRRFVQMFSDVVMELPKSRFEKLIDEMKEKRGVTADTELDENDMRELTARFKAFYKEQLGRDFPSDPAEQLLAAVRAVFRSWNNARAITYRRLNDIPGDWGTAVNVQMMVFGNMGSDSGTGVAFTRNPATGEKKLYGEFLMNAQGEDVVAGIRTPLPISELEKSNPEAYAALLEISDKLEKHNRDMQDMEFTIERGKLWMLQTRSGKRTAQAALRIAAALVEEGLCTKEEALLRIEARSLDTLLHPRFDERALREVKPVATGLAASPGAATGRVYFTAEEAKEAAKDGPVLLVRQETSPEDIEGMAAAKGILTARGGMTSHAAVVARGMGTCCVAGCSGLNIDVETKRATLAGEALHEGDWLSIDGSTGNVYRGQIPSVPAEVSGDLATITGWADSIRSLRIRTNADTPEDAAAAVSFGAEGIGLTRTEHMFFAADRISAMREMIVSKTAEARRRALDKLLPMQRGDFEGIFRAMGERPVTIRLLDPPLHEFLPTADSDIKALASEMGLSFEELRDTIRDLHEINPMMGFRGCRLPVRYPEIAEMQTRAIIQAAISVSSETGLNIVPEIMIPLVCEARELKYVKSIVTTAADDEIKKSGRSLKYLVGTMIELPRAALTADEIAQEAEFFSFGTNDLTQMTYGFSRDDAAKFLDSYYEKKLLEFDPFARFDAEATGKLVELAVKLGRSTRPELKIGVCGEHGGDPSSIEFFHNAGLDYVSCSPFRVPIARLAAAQAQIKSPRPAK
ncbi:MAG: pyruvate, phosphate dikinase [Oscillospiraceae bacterium]|jgi:pyruvate,orthophosphate dikinase